MLLRITLPLTLAVLAVGPVARAQENAKPAETKPAADPAKANPDGKTQDPDRAHKSAAEQLQDLTRERENLEKEIAYARERAANATKLLREKFGSRNFQPQVIDAGTSASVMPAVSTPVAQINQPRKARLMEEKERQAYGDGVMMAVDGNPITTAEVDAMVSYLSTVTAAGDSVAINQRATMEAIRIHTLLAAFPETSAEAMKHVEMARNELAQGQKWSDVLGRYGAGPNMTQDGKVQITRFCPYGIDVERAAFATPEGKISDPVHGLTGMVLLAVDKVLKGDGQNDVVEARMLLVPYNMDQPEVDRNRGRAALGQIDLALREAKDFGRLPVIMQPADGGKKQDAVPLQEDPVKEDGKKEDAPKEGAKKQ